MSYDVPHAGAKSRSRDNIYIISAKSVCAEGVG